MSTPKCKAKDPASCRFHGTTKTLLQYNHETGYGYFNIDFEKVSQNNFKESEAFKLLLSKEQEKAIHDYCQQDYSRINKLLKGKTNPEKYDEETKKQVELIRSALEKFPTQREKIVYRATRPYDNKGEQLGFLYPEDAEKYFTDKYKVGSVITLDGIVSATEDPNSLADFSTPGYDVWEHKPSIFAQNYTREEFYHMDKGHGLSNLVFEIVTKKGVSVSSFGQTYGKKEQEVILPNNVQYRVKEVLPNTKVDLINRLPHRNGQEKRVWTIVRLEEI